MFFKSFLKFSSYLMIFFLLTLDRESIKNPIKFISFAFKEVTSSFCAKNYFFTFWRIYFLIFICELLKIEQKLHWNIVCHIFFKLFPLLIVQFIKNEALIALNFMLIVLNNFQINLIKMTLKRIMKSWIVFLLHLTFQIFFVGFCF